ncbi:HVO_2922 family protein [Natronomonas sp.]|uniref:HVO_2922 family protein n=1 Tax=Natronomonas sp. TaxID=2184060 RepID=UPI00261586CF|nr:HVO_2922 family protein [Natronomonas sp.]
MSGETIHGEKRTRSRRGIASYLRRIANALGRGEPVPADENRTVTVDPPEETDFEIELEREGDTLSLELEMEWEEAEGDVETGVNASKATFQRYEDAAGKWRWRLRHDNGNIIADSSEGYASKQKATQGLESVRTNAPGAAVVDGSTEESGTPGEDASSATFELFEDAGGKWRWRLRHDNGNIIADGGQGYASKQKAKQGLGSVRLNVPGAAVTDAE